MGEHRAHKNQRSGAESKGFALSHRGQHELGAPVILHAGDVVTGHNEQARHRQQAEQPPVAPPQLGGKVDGVVESGPHHPHEAPDEAGKYQPFEEGGGVLFDGGKIVGKPGGHINTSVWNHFLQSNILGPNIPKVNGFSPAFARVRPKTKTPWDHPKR